MKKEHMIEIFSVEGKDESIDSLTEKLTIKIREWILVKKEGRDIVSATTTFSSIKEADNNENITVATCTIIHNTVIEV